MEVRQLKQEQRMQQQMMSAAPAGQPPPPPPGYYYPQQGQVPPAPPGYYYPQLGQAPPPAPPGYHYPPAAGLAPSPGHPVPVPAPQPVPVPAPVAAPAPMTPAAGPETPPAAAPVPQAPVAAETAPTPAAAPAAPAQSAPAAAAPAAAAAVATAATVQGQPAYAPPQVYQAHSPYAYPYPYPMPVPMAAAAPRPAQQPFTPKHALGPARPMRPAPTAPTAAAAAGAASAAKKHEIVFYTHPLAFNPSKVAIMLVEKGLSFKTVEVDILTGGNLEPKYMKINPTGQVPTLTVDGKPITESLRICEYLDTIDNKPLGGNTVDRAFIKEFSEAIDKYNGNLWAFGHSNQKLLDKLRKVDIYRKNFAAKKANAYPNLRAAYTSKIKTMGVNLDNALDPDEMAAVNLYLDQLLDKAEERLQPPPGAIGGATALFLAGPEFSMVDALFAPILFRINVLGMHGQLIQPRPRLANYFARISVRPSYKQAYEDAPDKWGGGIALTRAMMKIRARSLFSWL